MSIFRDGYEGARVADQPLISSILESLKIIEAMLLDGSVSTNKIKNTAVTLAKLGTDIYGAAGYPVDIAATESDGALLTLPRADHRHAHPATLHPIALGPWGRVNLAASLVDDDLELDAAGFIVAPYAGQIRAISVRSNAARTAGSATFTPTKNGATQAVSAVLDATNPQNHHAVVAAGTITFAAGDRLGAEVNTTSAWAPTTADITTFVWVTFDLI